METENAQSRLLVGFENFTNITVGFIVTMAVQLFTLPMFGIQIFISEVMVISLILVTAALAKNMLIRWVFALFAQRAQ